MVNPVDLREKATPDATMDFTQTSRDGTDLLPIRISTSDGNGPRAHTHAYTYTHTRQSTSPRAGYYITYVLGEYYK